MPTIVNIAPFGNGMVLNYDDGSTVTFVPTGQDVYLPTTGTTNTDIGDNGGVGTADDTDTDPSTSAPDPGPPDPVVTPDGPDLYNPYKAEGVSVGGDWNSHLARTGRGGTDYPYGDATPIKAPAAGTLHVSGGTGEYAAGNVGSAGLRSILYLDKTFIRKQARGRSEAEGPLRALVFQHQSRFAKAKHYNRGDIIGFTGNTGNGVYHLHVHGLDRGGSRMDFLKMFDS